MASNVNTTATMDSIKKKMASMRQEKDNATDRGERAEQNQKDLEEKLKAVRYLMFSTEKILSFYYSLKKKSIVYKKRFKRPKLISMRLKNNYPKPIQNLKPKKKQLPM